MQQERERGRAGRAESWRLPSVDPKCELCLVGFLESDFLPVTPFPWERLPVGTPEPRARTLPLSPGGKPARLGRAQVALSQLLGAVMLTAASWPHCAPDNPPFTHYGLVANSPLCVHLETLMEPQS